MGYILRTLRAVSPLGDLTKAKPHCLMSQCLWKDSIDSLKAVQKLLICPVLWSGIDLNPICQKITRHQCNILTLGDRL